MGNCCLGCCPSPPPPASTSSQSLSQPPPPDPNSQSAPQPSLDSNSQRPSQPPPDPNSQVQIVDYKQQFGNIEDATQPDPLIHRIDQLPCSIKKQKQSGQNPKPESSKMLEFVTDNVVGASKLVGHISTEGEAVQKGNLVSKLPEEMEKVARRAVEGLGKLHWIAVGFSVIAFAVGRIRRVLLDMRGEGQRRAVIVHGFGGIGKTTLANCVMSQLDFSGSRHSRIELDEKQSDVRSYQQKPCKYLTAHTPRFEDSSEGRDEALERESTSIHIDDALSKTRPKELSPSDLCLPSESRMPVTMHMSPAQIDAVAIACDGVPLLLQVYARYLAHHSDPEVCREMLAALSEGDISYADEHLVVDGALANVGSHDDVVVHDVLRALGIKLGEDSRVRRDDDWQRALAEKKEFKGMWLLEAKGIDVLDIECQRLSAVMVLAVGWWIRLTGECRVSLPKLRYLSIQNPARGIPIFEGMDALQCSTLEYDGGNSQTLWENVKYTEPQVESWTDGKVSG